MKQHTGIITATISCNKDTLKTLYYVLTLQYLESTGWQNKISLPVQSDFIAMREITVMTLTRRWSRNIQYWETYNVPATRASFGQRLNQSIVQPDINAGNFSARLRNFSPTGEKHKTTWRFCRTRDMKYSYKFSLVGGRLGNSRFITGIRSPRISSISSRANKLDTWE